jgi:hypothetical protein
MPTAANCAARLQKVASRKQPMHVLIEQLQGLRMKILGGLASHRQFLGRIREKAGGEAIARFSPPESTRQEAYCDRIRPDFSRKFQMSDAQGDPGTLALV